MTATPRVRSRRPVFSTADEARADLKRRLAVTFRVFARQGFDEGVAGHVTARDPEFPDRFWVNPFGMHFAQIRVRDLICVDSDGVVVDGDWPVNRAAFAIHSQVHTARPDVVAAAHTHSTHGRAYSALGRLLPPTTQDACAFYEDHGVYEEYTGVVLDPDEGKRIATALSDYKAVILRSHGLLTVGASVDSAAWWFLALERSCQVQLLAQAAGEPIEIDPDQAAITRSQVGNERMGWRSFQPWYDRVIAEEPDVLDD